MTCGVPRILAFGFCGRFRDCYRSFPRCVRCEILFRWYRSVVSRAHRFYLIFFYTKSQDALIRNEIRMFFGGDFGKK